MITAFSAIVAGVMDLLSQEPAVASNIYRARSQVIPKTDVTAATVQWDGGVPQRGTIFNAPVDWRSRITVECYARSTTAASGGDEAVDAVLLAVYNRIAANPTLGNLVFETGEPALEAEYGVDGEKTGWVRMTYVVSHRTKNATLEKS